MKYHRETHPYSLDDDGPSDFKPNSTSDFDLVYITSYRDHLSRRVIDQIRLIKNISQLMNKPEDLVSTS